VIIFVLMRTTPGDPVQIMMGGDTNPQLEAALRKQLQLDAPVYVQYVSWIGNILQGSMGKSIRTTEPVARVLADRLPKTISLALLGMVMSLVLAIPMGLVAATRRNSAADYISMFLATIFWSVPNFVVAMLLVVVVGVYLHWLPISGSGDLFSDPLGAWRYMLMPTISLGLSGAAVMARMLRASLLDVLRSDYMRTARAKGLREQTVLVRHALRNAIIPVIAIAAISFGRLLGGAVVVEQVFGLSGLGSLMVQAVYARDFPVIQGATLLAAVVFIGVNLLADLSYAMVDPRIRLSWQS
jgi:peptide/nickel transport system permease protein